MLNLFIQRIYKPLIVVAIFINIFIFLALLGYSPFDSSPYTVVIPKAKTLNFCGQWGANVADALFHFFGPSAFAIPPFFLFFFLFNFNQFKNKRINAAFLLLFITTLSLFCFLGSYLQDILFSYNFLLAGGVVGLTEKTLLVPNIGPIGATTAFLLLYFLNFFLFLPKKFKNS